ncbi:MAG: SRPBCC family protein [Gemmatimonadaceae bacterium]
MNKLTITAGDNNDLIMTRSFDAPRDLVFKAFTTPELIKRWLFGPPGWEMTECAIDLRVGGKYRYAWSNIDGSSMGMGGEYREINKPEKIVSTEKFDQAWYEGEAIGTLTLTEANGKTTAVTKVQYGSKETRDNVLKSPMESGVAAGYDRLEEVLASL